MNEGRVEFANVEWVGDCMAAELRRRCLLVCLSRLLFRECLVDEAGVLGFSKVYSTFFGE
jgi:hypothetical protein